MSECEDCNGVINFQPLFPHGYEGCRICGKSLEGENK